MSAKFLIAASALSLSACHVGTRAESRDVGPSANRSYQVAQFDRIEVAGPYEVKVVTGKAGAISAVGGQNLLDETEVKVEDGVLSIGPKKHNGMRWKWTNGTAVFTVPVAALKGAAIAGSGSVAVDKLAGDFHGELAGSGNIDLASVNGGALKFDIAGSGNVKAVGAADSVSVDIAGSGDADLAGVAAKSAKVSIAGSGGVRAKASDSADVSIMGSGDVEIGGGAKCKVSKMGSGNVNCG